MKYIKFELDGKVYCHDALQAREIVRLQKEERDVAANKMIRSMAIRVEDPSGEAEKDESKTGTGSATQGATSTGELGGQKQE